jgi:hypothetical protein
MSSSVSELGGAPLLRSHVIRCRALGQTGGKLSMP